MSFEINTAIKSMGIERVYDLVNAIRNSSSPYFKEMTPLANATNVAEWGEALQYNRQLQNEFINGLVNRIGTVLVRNTILQNPLSQFKGNRIALGDTIEEIFVDLTREHLYDPEKAETELFKREIPNVHVLFHKLNRKGYYKTTIQENSLLSAFTSWEKFGQFTGNIIQSLYNSAEVDEYKYMKLLLSKYHADGHFKVVALDNNYTDSDLIKKARAYAMHMTLPQGSRNYNSLAVHTRTLQDDLYVFMTPEKAASIDVDVLASAFNMSKAEFIGRRMILDSLGENPETGETIEMILADRNLFVVHDQNIQMTNEFNAQGLYWNTWLHVWQYLSTSRFANAVAFVKGVPTTEVLTEVIVNPEIREIKDGRAYDFTAYLQTIDGRSLGTLGTDYDISWIAKDSTGTAITTGVTITTSTDKQTATLTTANTSPEQFTLVCEVSYDIANVEGASTKSGKSIISVDRQTTV